MIATASASGIEWFTAKNSQLERAQPLGLPLARRSASTARCAARRSFASTSASVNCDPTSGMSGLCASRYGTAPMWSSWPWVSTIASTSSSRSRIDAKSGRIRSTPGWSTSGNSTPQSTTSSRPPNSNTRHVAADRAEPAERRDPQAGRRAAAAVRRARRARPSPHRTRVQVGHLIGVAEGAARTRRSPPAAARSRRGWPSHQRRPHRAGRAGPAGAARPWPG